MEELSTEATERIVTRMMLELGIPAHLKGYHYIRTAVLLSLREKETMTNVTKTIYPMVAKQYETSGQKVERAIRNAIEVSWSRGNMDYMTELFGYSSNSLVGRPTNSEYIARIVDELRLQARN